jgi:hypothetical protein
MAYLGCNGMGFVDRDALDTRMFLLKGLEEIKKVISHRELANIN